LDDEGEAVQIVDGIDAGTRALATGTVIDWITIVIFINVLV